MTALPNHSTARGQKRSRLGAARPVSKLTSPKGGFRRAQPDFVVGYARTFVQYPSGERL